MTKLAEMYISLMPVIFTGILNMIWIKLPFLTALKKPVDNGRILSDGNRLFGDNKTWKGFAGYCLLAVACSLAWGFICGRFTYLNTHNYFYYGYDNTVRFNLLIGCLLGLAYALFELPNSFLKRRLGIKEGEAPAGFKRSFFILLDQSDSLFGCVLVICLFYRMAIPFYFCYVLVGALSHLIINMLLYFTHLRGQMF